MKRSQDSCSGSEGRDALDDFTGERLRVAGPLRPALCDEFEDVEALDFFGVGVAARVLLQNMCGSEPALLLDVDVIGCFGDFIYVKHRG